MELYYEEKGKGTPLVLLHGNGENHEYFRHQIDCFSEDFRVIALDTRGHGLSPRGDGEFSIKRFSEDLLGFLDELRVEKANILGFSDGGNIALRFALDHPKRVLKLVLNGANLFPEGVKRSTQIPIELAYKAVKKLAEKDEKARGKAEILGLMVNEPHVSPEELKALDMPVLVIVGSRDMILKKHSELIAKSIRKSEFVVIKGDHFIADKKPLEFNEAVSSFLKKND